MTKWIPGIVMAGALVLAGCSKAPEVSEQMEISGVKLDVPKLQQAFASDKPELQASVSKAVMSIRYGQYDQALAELQKLAGTPTLTEPQKQVASALMEQVKQLAAKAPPKPPQ